MIYHIILVALDVLKLIAGVFLLLLVAFIFNCIHDFLAGVFPWYRDLINSDPYYPKNL